MPKGRCTNFGNCSKADSREILDIPAGADFECPECESELLAADTGGGGRPVPAKFVTGLVLVGLIGIGGWFLWPDGGVDDPEAITVVTEETEPDPKQEHDSHTEEVPDMHPADEEYERLQALYGDSKVSPAELKRQWQEGENRFPDDYRFTLERARLIVWKNNTAHPYEMFYDAAEKAISQGKANRMLRDLRKEEPTTYRRISTGHRQWEVLIEALENNEAHELRDLHAH